MCCIVGCVVMVPGMIVMSLIGQAGALYALSKEGEGRPSIVPIGLTPDGVRIVKANLEVTSRQFRENLLRLAAGSPLTRTPLIPAYSSSLGIDSMTFSPSLYNLDLVSNPRNLLADSFVTPQYIPPLVPSSTVGTDLLVMPSRPKTVVDYGLDEMVHVMTSPTTEEVIRENPWIVTRQPVNVLRYLDREIILPPKRLIVDASTSIPVVTAMGMTTSTQLRKAKELALLAGQDTITGIADQTREVLLQQSLFRSSLVYLPSLIQTTGADFARKSDTALQTSLASQVITPQDVATLRQTKLIAEKIDLHTDSRGLVTALTSRLNVPALQPRPVMANLSGIAILREVNVLGRQDLGSRAVLRDTAYELAARQAGGLPTEPVARLVVPEETYTTAHYHVGSDPVYEPSIYLLALEQSMSHIARIDQQQVPPDLCKTRLPSSTGKKSGDLVPVPVRTRPSG